MSSHWFYKTESATDLEQGDLLRKSRELDELLNCFHPHYAKHPENTYYSVISQSCDLVRRAGATCEARYISIAPVRKLEVIVHREFDSQLIKPDAGAPFGTEGVKAEVERFVQRLLNNNEASYFHYPQEATVGLVAPMCAVLALPIAFRVEHYEKFLGARLVGVGDVFQAKLGWLLGQLYSRVGTPDMSPSEIQTKVVEATSWLGVWFSSEDYRQLKRLIAEHRQNKPTEPVDERVTREFIGRIKKKKTLVIDRVLDIATGLGLCGNPSPERGKFRKALDQDADFARFFQSA